ncbi:MAG: AzlD domain-containing protein [Pseudomonadota bacterium]
MTFASFDMWWWPFAFILLAAAIPTGVWRWIGVLAVGDLSEGSDILVLIRCVATGLVAAVVGQIIFAPSGALMLLPIWVRVGAALSAFAVFMLGGRRLAVGILTGEVLLLAGWFALAVG